KGLEWLMATARILRAPCKICGLGTAASAGYVAARRESPLADRGGPTMSWSTPCLTRGGGRSVRQCDSTMSLPFSREQFFDVFAQYNVSVWPLQPVIVVLG